jgi:hypothetical protein
MTPAKITHPDEVPDDGLPNPIEPPEATDDQGWERADEPLIDRRMTTYTIRLAKRDVERLRIVAAERGEAATGLLRGWVLDALALAERPREGAPTAREELFLAQETIERAVRNARAAVDAVIRSISEVDVAPRLSDESKVGRIPKKSRKSRTQTGTAARTGRYVKSNPSGQMAKAAKTGRGAKNTTTPSRTGRNV